MKIAIVYDVAYPYRFGGGEKRNWEIARRLAAGGHEVWLVSMQMWEGSQELVREGVHCVGICPWKQNFFKTGRRSVMEPWYFSRHLYAYLKRHPEFDLVDCGNFPYLPCIAAKLATRSSKTKLVITWFEIRGLKRWMEHRGLLGIGAWMLERITSRLTSHNIAISQFTADRALEVFKMKDIAVIPCGVDCSTVLPESGIPRQDQLLYVGRLVEYKRVDMLMEAFSRLAGEFPWYMLKVVGQGDSKKKLADLAVKLGLGERVAFAESLSDSDLRGEYAKSKVFILPSEQEGFGIVLVESMLAGTPVVVLKAPNSAAVELVSNENNGLVVENVEQMTDALRRLLADEALRRKLADAGKQTAAKYDWGRAIIPRLEKYYQQALS